MLEEILELSQHFIRLLHRPYRRYFLSEYSLDHRFVIITGQRGVGKSTVLAQYLVEQYPAYLQTQEALYVPADHFVMGRYTLYEIAEEFAGLGGKLLCVDEVHKYPDWSKELKSICDTFPSLQLIVSGSSTLEIMQGTHDLSRRAVVFRMTGLSFREYLEMRTGITAEAFSLSDIFVDHVALASDTVKKVENMETKIRRLFQDYLRAGYYPYFQEFTDESFYHLAIEKNMHTSIENDLLAVYPNLSGTSIKKIRQLLSVIAGSVPFTPDLKRLKELVDVDDERTLKSYLKYLEDAGIILSLCKRGEGLRALEKPEKIYLNNPNQIYAIGSQTSRAPGNIRETFFCSMLTKDHTLIAPESGDFFVDNRFTVEVGGKNKTSRQIKDVSNAYLAVDSIEVGALRRIPLWLFGFLY